MISPSEMARDHQVAARDDKDTRERTGWRSTGTESPAGTPRASRAHPGAAGQDARVCARDLRLTLAREHIDRPAGDDAIPVLL
jgi:hypothetical protein